MATTTHDVAIVGGGAAGLSAALVLGRARRRVVLIDAGEPRNAPASHMHGFLSRDGMPPAELLEAGRAEAGRLRSRVPLRPCRLARTRLRSHARRRREFEARRLLIATGATDELPSIPRLQERWGRDFLHCPYCHGWEVRDQPLGVLGTGPGSAEHAQLIRQWTDDLIFFTHSHAITDAERDELEARDIRVVDGEVRELVVEDDRLRGVVLGDGRTVERAALFIRPEIRPRLDGLLKHLGCDTDDLGFVRVDNVGRTNAPGVWAVGNAANPRAQVITAAGEGSSAAISINTDLIQEDIDNALHAAAKGQPPAIERSRMTNPPEHLPAVPPPSKHQLALMIWLCVFPTLTAINLAFGDWLRYVVAGHAHLRACHDRGADRDLRADAAPAPPAQSSSREQSSEPTRARTTVLNVFPHEPRIVTSATRQGSPHSPPGKGSA